MSLALAPPPAPLAETKARVRTSRSRRWPRLWTEQSLLLERQHERIEALLEQLIDGHGVSSEHCCRLVRSLGLHLRLEERWLDQAGCLCPGHRVAHRQAAALAATIPAGASERLGWLMDLQQWFQHHRFGADAVAYARASLSDQP